VGLGLRVEGAGCVSLGFGGWFRVKGLGFRVKG